MIVKSLPRQAKTRAKGLDASWCAPRQAKPSTRAHASPSPMRMPASPRTHVAYACAQRQHPRQAAPSARQQAANCNAHARQRHTALNGMRQRLPAPGAKTFQPCRQPAPSHARPTSSRTVPRTKQLPGFYYDAEKNRYFPYKGPIPGSSSKPSPAPPPPPPKQGCKWAEPSRAFECPGSALRKPLNEPASMLKAQA
ncbi:hypothetical protein PHJA_002226600 [Phtheirospermum japonicum]|uniref:Uncharacterized protein n=1 Tax=Phtheirospermum japonicum TaxID=374723 RepID=A0A830CND5_9LAMI|nr:hypothetical protein PHJA_002226600 [Phtheirospermum japonicum]